MPFSCNNHVHFQSLLVQWQSKHSVQMRCHPVASSEAGYREFGASHLAVMHHLRLMLKKQRPLPLSQRCSGSLLR
jgi:hypothetical protein